VTVDHFQQYFNYRVLNSQSLAKETCIQRPYATPLPFWNWNKLIFGFKYLKKLFNYNDLYNFFKVRH